MGTRPGGPGGARGAELVDRPALARCAGSRSMEETNGASDYTFGFKHPDD